MGKRERENACIICGHYHRYEEGEICGICGHKLPLISDNPIKFVAFPCEILPDFLFLGSFDHASNSQALHAQGISHILNTVPSCHNLYRNSFSYYSLPYDKDSFFDDAIQYLEKCENEKARVLVYCMTGKSRSPAIVIAYLMKCKGWRFEQSYQWVKERRPTVELTQAVYEQLQQYEKSLFGATRTALATDSVSFGFAVNGAITAPSFDTNTCSSIFDRSLDVPPQQFTFGASQGANQVNATVTNLPMGDA
ncbi:hypothetical protein vseg_018092 [Gypsophila vaccaria]